MKRKRTKLRMEVRKLSQVNRRLSKDLAGLNDDVIHNNLVLIEVLDKVRFEVLEVSLLSGLLMGSLKFDEAQCTAAMERVHLLAKERFKPLSSMICDGANDDWLRSVLGGEGGGTPDGTPPYKRPG